MIYHSANFTSLHFVHRSRTMSDIQKSFNAGQTKGKAYEKASQLTESAKGAVDAARDKAATAAQSTKETAQHGQEQASGFLQQTGEQVKNVAEGTVEGVKNGLGMNHKK